MLLLLNYLTFPIQAVKTLADVEDGLVSLLAPGKMGDVLDKPEEAHTEGTTLAVHHTAYPRIHDQEGLGQNLVAQIAGWVAETDKDKVVEICGVEVADAVSFVGSDVAGVHVAWVLATVVLELLWTTVQPEK